MKTLKKFETYGYTLAKVLNMNKLEIHMKSTCADLEIPINGKPFQLPREVCKEFCYFTVEETDEIMSILDITIDKYPPGDRGWFVCDFQCEKCEWSFVSIHDKAPWGKQ